MSEFTVAKANSYINEKQKTVITTYKPEHHFTAQVGWINDPNGFVFFRGEYHLFYQFYPYDSVWGPMHWGHAKSKDLMVWEHLPVALAPDQYYDKDGCFSGSAIVKDDVLWLMYTGHIINEDGSIIECQNMAFSRDGVTFEKIKENPVATGAMLPEYLSSSDFRDPKLFEKDGCFYSVVAAKHEENVGTIILLSSEDLISWRFESIFLKGEPQQGIMWECPDYFELNGNSYLIVSPMRYEKDGNDFANINSSIVISGEVDWKTKTFTQKFVKEIDHGHDFYAPQTMLDNHGNRIMIAWMQMWGRTFITHDLGHGWAGTMTLPRILVEEDKALVQRIPDRVTFVLKPLEIGMLATEGFIKEDWSKGVRYRIGSIDDYVEFGYDKELEEVYIDRTHLALTISGEEIWPINRRSMSIKPSEVMVVIDNSCLEIVINGGQEVLSSTYFLIAQPILSLLE